MTQQVSIPRAFLIRGNLSVTEILYAVVDDDDEVMLNVLRCQLTY